jgi:hypothetical protein
MGRMIGEDAAPAMGEIGADHCGRLPAREIGLSALDGASLIEMTSGRDRAGLAGRGDGAMAPYRLTRPTVQCT